MKPAVDKRARDYIEELIESPKFYTSVLNFRKKNQIPGKGFGISVFDELLIAEVYPRIPDDILDKNSLIKSINNFLIRYGFSQEWFDFFSDYLLFEFIGDTENKKQIFLLDLGHRGQKKRDEQIEILNKNTIQNPIVILLPPFVSQRNIYDFIVSRWHQIENIQRKYNKELIKIVSTRRKNERIKQRDQYILKNHLLPKKKLMSKVADKFGDILDYTYLSKIIATGLKKKSVRR